MPGWTRSCEKRPDCVHVDIIPSEHPVGLSPLRRNGLEDKGDAASDATAESFASIFGANRATEATILKAMRHPIEAAVQLACFRIVHPRREAQTGNAKAYSLRRRLSGPVSA